MGFHSTFIAESVSWGQPSMRTMCEGELPGLDDHYESQALSGCRGFQE